MAPTKEPRRTTNKRYSSLNEVSPEKDEVRSSRNKQRKRKLSDKSGSKWNDEELQRFYEAYRKYGKDWKKVAAVVSSKSVEIVEGLYKMNRAYLSLPEGIAPAVGLVVMMTDYYNVLEESDSEERESNDVPRYQIPMKRKRGKNQLSVTNDSVQSQSIASNDGSLLKRRQIDVCDEDPTREEQEEGEDIEVIGPMTRSRTKKLEDALQKRILALGEPPLEGGSSQPKAVGKRTPRVQVKYSDKTNDMENYVFHTKRNLKSSVDANDDEVALALAPLVDVALTEAAHRGGSPHASQKLYKRSKQKFSPAQSRQRMHPESETVPAKFYDASFDEECLEDESSSRDALQTLADLSLMIPTSTVGYESSVKLKEEKKTLDKDKSALPEGTSTGKNRYKIKLPHLKEKVDHAVPGDKIKLPRLKEKVDHAVPGDKIKLPLLKEKVDHAVPGDKIKLPGLKEKVDHAVPGVGSSTKHRSRRKMILQRPLTPKEKSSENILKRKPNKNLNPVQDRALFFKEKLGGCLSSYMVRRWCVFEWFYSAIDYPWFSKREFMEYLDHVDLGKFPKLTRVEWSVIKSSLGNPRRFSRHFLHGERQKVKQYRESVRGLYNALQTGIRYGLPIDLAKPLCAGQRVIALHSETREIHDGSVLTVDHDKYSIQFDRPELGVEFIMDIDCMPLNPLDNMPETLRQIGAGSVPCMSDKPHMKRNSTFRGGMKFVSSGPVEKAPTSSSITLAEPKKDSIAMRHLRKHNTYMRNSLLPPVNPKASSDIHGGPPRTMDGSLVQELGSIVVDIIKASRLRAHAMVNAAFQAYSSVKEGEDALMRIWQALDCADYQPLATNSRLPVIVSQEQMSGSFDYHNLSIHCSSEPLLNDASGQKLQNDSDKVGCEIPLELITSCVATWIMIQTCAVQQYPPAEVTQILDSVVTSLRPHSPRNLPLYREIQTCMGRIKTRI